MLGKEDEERQQAQLSNLPPTAGEKREGKQL